MARARCRADWTWTLPAAGSSLEPAAGRSPLRPVGLRSVAVEEARDGLTVVATRTDGVTVQRPARDSAKGLDAAVVAAVPS